ncbi:MAG: GtrA family protein [Bacteroidales bacterium]|nr:GtrA family protein [Bacteroidales bacterium]
MWKEKILDLIKKHRNFILYCLIGVLNTGVDFGVFALLDHVGLHYIIAHVISYHCGIFCSFFLNRQYNFKVADKPVQRFFSFYSASLVALVASAGLLYLFVSVFGMHHLLGKLIATAIIVVCQFLFVKHFTFRKS